MPEMNESVHPVRSGDPQSEQRQGSFFVHRAASKPLAWPLLSPIVGSRWGRDGLKSAARHR